MVKRLLTLLFGLMATISLMAQSETKSVTITESNIQYWVGNGSNSSVIAIGWDATSASYTPTVVVWGIHWGGSITLLDALDTLMAYDSRFTYTISNSYLTGLYYNDPTAGVNLTPVQGYNCNNYNGVYEFTPLTSTWLRISESTCENYNFTGVNNLIYASNPNGSGTLPDSVDASLPFSDILYWVGSGTDSAEFIVNFAQPDTALAWGYLFNGSTTAQAMINAIAAADPRFWTVGSPSSGGDIHFVTDNGDTLGLSPVDPAVGYNFWWTNLNGVSAGSGSAETLHNGDVFKYGDLNSATGWDMMWGYYMEEAWNTIPTPVPVPGNTPDTPDDASFAASDILYWVGEGSNEVVLAVNWADTALAWGYRFNGESATVTNMMDAITAADPRFSYSLNSWGGVDDITFTTDNGTFSITPGNYWWSLLNHVGGMGLSDVLHNGDFYKWGDLSVAVITDSTWISQYGGYWDYTYVWPYTIHPVSIPTSTPDIPTSATISADQIEYWVGEGSNEVIFVVNWADSALAWGYRFNSDSVTLQTIMDDIQTADPRFSYVTNDWGIDDINFTSGNVTLGKVQYSWWEHSINSIESAGVYSYLHNGDFSRWADPMGGVIVDSIYIAAYNYTQYIYAYPRTIHAVTQPAGHGPFCGAAETEGSTAIAYNDSRIKAWATGCTLELGSQNLSNPSAPVVNYGSADDAIGAASTSTMDVVSLGDGGSATLTFAQPIMNGEGADFAVFENPFNDYFLELAFVEVSSDGQHFVRFPATSLTQTARQITSSVDPTYINNLAGKYRVGFGTPFDLDELRDSAGIDINNITHVRVIDVVGSIDPEYGTYDAFGHIINDPFPTVSHSAGFDLDGVAVINQKTERIELTENGVMMSIYPNPATDLVSINLDNLESIDATMFDINGHAVMTLTLHNGANTIDISTLHNGVYLIRAAGTVMKLVKR